MSSPKEFYRQRKAVKPVTELELRQKVVDIMHGWVGYSESNGKYKEIIDIYNTQSPLPRGHKLSYSEPWCAATVTAAGIKAGLSDIIFGECSCSAMIELYKAAGRWQEDDTYVPQIGDIVMYDWDDGKDYVVTDNTGAPDHTGYVTDILGTDMSIAEGNKSGAVGYRALQVNGRYIRGYCLPDYGSMAAEDKDEEDEEMAKRYERLSDIPANYDFRNIVDDLMTAGIIGGDGSDPDGNNDVIDLSHDMVRMLVFEYRAGVYDNAISAAGLDPTRYK